MIKVCPDCGSSSLIMTSTHVTVKKYLSECRVFGEGLLTDFLWDDDEDQEQTPETIRTYICGNDNCNHAYDDSDIDQVIIEEMIPEENFDYEHN